MERRSTRRPVATYLTDAGNLDQINAQMTTEIRHDIVVVQDSTSVETLKPETSSSKNHDVGLKMAVRTSRCQSIVNFRFADEVYRWRS